MKMKLGLHQIDFDGIQENLENLVLGVDELEFMNNEFNLLFENLENDLQCLKETNVVLLNCVKKLLEERKD